MVGASEFFFNPQLFVFFVLFAVVAFARAVRFHQRTGRNPWGIHPVLWLAAGLIFGIIGSILCLVAVYTSHPDSHRTPSSGPYGYGPPPGPGGYRPPGYAAPPAGPPPPPPPQTAPASWMPDPTGRHQHRYWSGSAWTDHVADDGVSSLDPVIAGTAGPVAPAAPGGTGGNGSTAPLPSFPPFPGGAGS